VPLVTRIVADTVTLPVEEQVAPVMPPPPLDEVEELVLDVELVDDVLEVELVLELDEPEPPYEQ